MPAVRCENSIGTELRSSSSSEAERIAVCRTAIVLRRARLLVHCARNRRPQGISAGVSRIKPLNNQEEEALRDSISEIIEQAVQTEKLGFQFYSSMAEKFTDDEKINKLFGLLALKEQEHEKTFLSLMDNISKQSTEDWEEVCKYMRAIVESEFFLGTNKSLPSLDHITSASAAVKFAISFEKETLLYFYNMKDVISGSDVINSIIDEEKSHIVWLSDYERGLQD